MLLFARSLCPGGFRYVLAMAQLNPAWAFVIGSPEVALSFVLILWIAARWFLRPADRKRTEWMLAFSCLAGFSGGLLLAIATALSRIRPYKYDEFVCRIDSLFGQPSWALGRWVAAHSWLRCLMIFSYQIIPIIIISVFAIYLWGRSEGEALQVIRVFTLNVCAAPLFYLLFPVCGPVFAFPHFPYAAPHNLVPHLIRLNAAPNGVPSVHASCALLILWFLRHWWWGRIAGAIFLALTVVATMGGGQHYLFDLLCSVPYTVAVYLVAVRSEARETDPTEISSSAPQPSRQAPAAAAD